MSKIKENKCDICNEFVYRGHNTYCLQCANTIIEELEIDNYDLVHAMVEKFIKSYEEDWSKNEKQD